MGQKEWSVDKVAISLALYEDNIKESAHRNIDIRSCRTGKVFGTEESGRCQVLGRIVRKEESDSD